MTDIELLVEEVEHEARHKVGDGMHPQDALEAAAREVAHRRAYEGPTSELVRRASPPTASDYGEFGPI